LEHSPAVSYEGRRLPIFKTRLGNFIARALRHFTSWGEGFFFFRLGVVLGFPL